MGLNDIRLYGFDYVWMIDGDILLRSINWVAFWQQILLLHPKIAQPSIIGTKEGVYSSYHSVLRHQQDSRLLAAESSIVELMTPLFHVDTWLGYRDVLTKHPELRILRRIRVGGTWCHYAKNNMTGQQVIPSQKLSGYDQSISISLYESFVLGTLPNSYHAW